MARHIDFFKALLTREDTDRISLMGETVIADLHGMRPYEALRFIRNLIASCIGCSFTLVAIHGYRNGTAIKSILHEEPISRRIRGMETPDYNPGITLMTVAGDAA